MTSENKKRWIAKVRHILSDKEIDDDEYMVIIIIFVLWSQ